MDFTEVPPEVQAHLSRVGIANGGASLLTVRLNSDAHVEVDGFGMPFANIQDAEIDQYVNKYKPIVGNITLPSILRQREFVLAVRHPRTRLESLLNECWMPPPFSYPYGKDHTWDVDRFRTHSLDNRDKQQYRAAYSFEDDNSYVAVASNFDAQDVLWVQDDAEDIQKQMFPAYLSPKDPELTDPADPRSRFYVIVPMNKEFRMKHKATWPRLVQGGTCKVVLKTDADANGCVKWYDPRYSGLCA